MARIPYMPLFWGDYFGDTMDLSLEEHGAYLKLLGVTWQNGGVALPDDARRIARALGCSKTRWVTRLRPALAPFFDLTAGAWRSDRLEKEWNFSSNRAAKSRDNGKQGGRPKLLKSLDTENPAGNPEPNLDRTQKEPTYTRLGKKDSGDAVASPAADEPQPSSPVDLRRIIFGEIAAWLAAERGSTIASAKSWLGKAANTFGDGNLIDAYARIRAGPYQNDVVAALMADLKRKSNGHAPATARNLNTPVGKLWTGAALALQRRAAERAAAEREADRGSDRDPDVPLLDG